MNNNLIFEKAQKSFLWVISSSIVFQVINWVMTILVMRIITPTDYGIFGILMIGVQYLGPLTHFNISFWYVWKDDITEREEITVECAILMLSLIVFLLTLLSAPLFAKFFNQNELINDFRLLSFIFLTAGISKISLMKFEREINFKPTSILNVVMRLLQGGLTLTLAILGFGYKSLLYSLLFVRSLHAIILLKMRSPVLVRKGITRHFDLTALKTSWTFGFNITMGMFLWVIYSNADNLIIGKVFGAELLGYYSLAFFFIDMPLSKLNEWIRPVLHPFFSRLKVDLDTLNTVFLRFVFFYMVILVPIFFGIIILADEFIYFVLGAKWQGAVRFLKLLAFVGLLRSLSDLIGPYLVALGYPKYGKYANMVAAATMPLSFYVGTLFFDINGIFYTWFFVYPVVPLMMLCFFVKESGIPWYRYLSNILPAIISSSIMLLFIFLFRYSILNGEKSLPGFVGQIIVGSLTYFLSMIFLFKHKLIDAKLIFQQ